MGTKLFGVDIAGIIKQSMAKGLPSLTLIKEVAGARGTNMTDGQALAQRRYSCRGFIDDYQLSQIDGTNVQKGDKKILIIGDTLPKNVVPESNDRIVAEHTEYVIKGVPARDPAAATYICQSRG